MSKSDFVAGLFKKSSIHIVGKGEMVDLICSQYQAICNLGKELYCENPSHPFFLTYSEEQLWEWKEEREKREKETK